MWTKSQKSSLSTDGYFLQRVIFFERAEGNSGREAGAEKNVLLFPHGHPLTLARFQIPRSFYFVCDLDEL